MRKPAKPKRNRVAPAQDLIIQTIAHELPTRLHDRDSLLQSQALDGALKDKGGSAGPLQGAVKRSLARVRHGPVREVLLLDQHHPRVMLPEIGLIAVSVSLTSLNIEHGEWLAAGGEAFKTAEREWRLKDKRRGKPPIPPSPEPTQELILDRIILNASAWIQEELKDRTANNGLHIVILDASIVHGSGNFDILMTVLYRQSFYFTRFIREVIQRTRHVDATQTLQVPYRVGFPYASPTGTDDRLWA
jgi:hypothetical protein